MAKITIDLNTHQIKEAFEKLSAKEKVGLVEEFGKRTRKLRWDPLIQQIRSRVAKHRILQKEIDQICEEVRRERYERNKSDH